MLKKDKKKIWKEIEDTAWFIVMIMICFMIGVVWFAGALVLAFHIIDSCSINPFIFLSFWLAFMGFMYAGIIVAYIKVNIKEAKQE